MTKKVLQVTGGLDAGGIETLLVNILKNIDRQNIKIDFFVTAKKKYFYTDAIKSLGSHIYTYPFKSKNILLTPFYILSEIKVMFFKGHFDVVHAHHHFLNALTVFLAWLCGVKKRIAHAHNVLEISFPKPFKTPAAWFSRKIIFAFATDLLACSKEAGISLYGNNAKFKVINNGIEVDKFRFNEETRIFKRKELNIENKFVIGHIGRFEKQKNHTFLIDIFSEIYKSNTKAVLLLIGKGELENEIREKVKTLNLENNIKFLGVRNDISELLQAVDVFLLPSLHEGLPVSGIEAQAAGLVCFFSDKVTTDAGIINSYFLSIKDTKFAWANKIINICDKFERIDTCEEINKSHFNIKSTVKDMQNLYFV